MTKCTVAGGAEASCVPGAKDSVMKLLAMNMDATPGLLGTFTQAQPLRVQNLITCIVFYSSVTSCLYTLAYLALHFLLPVLFGGRGPVSFVLRFQNKNVWLFSVNA